jgi:hypothetical protein
VACADRGPTEWTRVVPLPATLSTRSTTEAQRREVISRRRAERWKPGPSYRCAWILSRRSVLAVSSSVAVSVAVRGRRVRGFLS